MNSVETDLIANSNATTHYRIVVDGELNDSWSDWLGDVILEIHHKINTSCQTTILGAIPDQAALRGLLNKIWDLNLTLISVTLQEDESIGETNE